MPQWQSKSDPIKEKRDLMAKTINSIIMTCYSGVSNVTEIDTKTILASAGTLVDGIFEKYKEAEVKVNLPVNMTDTDLDILS